MSSIQSLYLHLNSKFHYTVSPNLNKSPSLGSLSCKQNYHTLSFQLTKEPKFHSLFITNCSQSDIAKIPSLSPSPENKCVRFLKEKAVIFLVGSVIFLGGFGYNPRPTVALPGKMRASENLKELRDAQMGKSEEEEMFEKLLEKEPRNVEALKVLLHGNMRRGRNKEALEYVKRLTDIEPNEVEWKLLQALCYELMGQLSTAKRLFKEILKERPLLLRALHGLALVMHKNHEGPAVFEMLSKALEVACNERRVTEERNIKILIAQMLVVEGELEEGLKKFEELVQDNPRDFRPYLCQGIIYSLLDKKKEAADQFEIYRSLVPEEFPQRGFLDDVTFAAKTKSREQLQKNFDKQFSHRK